MTSSVVYRALSGEDVATAAQLHQEAFPGFFLSSLGPRFLREFYKAFLTDPDAVTVVAVAEGGDLCGIVVGSTNPSVFFRRLMVRRGVFFAGAAFPILLRRPSLVIRAAKGVVYRGGVPVEASGALLSSICVAPKYEGRGTGQELIERWVAEVTARGVATAYLTTDASGNDQVNRFYERAGWVKAGSYKTREGRAMNCLVWPRTGDG